MRILLLLLLLPAVIAAAPLPTRQSGGEGIQSLYHLNETNGTRGNNNASISTAPITHIGTVFSTVGCPGGCRDYNGSTDKSVGPVLIIPSVSGGGWGISMWFTTGVLLTSIGETFKEILVNQYNSGFMIGYENRAAQKKGFFAATTTTAGNTAAHTSVAIPINTWHHTAATAGDGGLYLWLNGVMVASAPYTGTTTVADKFSLLCVGTANGGTSCPNAFYNWDGYIDEIAIWDRRITPGEIQYLYNSQRGVQQ